MYVDLPTVKLALNEQGSQYDQLITAAITAASRHIDERTGRTFTRTEVPRPRTVRTRGRVTGTRRDGELLLVDDIAATAATVEVGDGAAWRPVPAGELEPEPADAPDSGWPITGLRWCTGGWSAWPRARVTATWGWPDVPAPVAEATKVLAVRLFKRKDNPEGVAGSAEWGLIRMPNLDPDVRALLAPYVLPGLA